MSKVDLDTREKELKAELAEIATFRRLFVKYGPEEDEEQAAVPTRRPAKKKRAPPKKAAVPAPPANAPKCFGHWAAAVDACVKECGVSGACGAATPAPA